MAARQSMHMSGGDAVIKLEPGPRIAAADRAAVAARAAAAPVEAAPGELSERLRRIRFFYDPLQIWLFGSRARGTHRPGSDWDLLVVVDDAASDACLDPDVAWRLQRGSGVFADVIGCRHSDFRADLARPNTLAFDAAREGRLIHSR
jgi:predicted nucleotidyltransferase